MAKVYRPRVELVLNGETKDVWCDWGTFDKKKDAVDAAREIKNSIDAGKYNGYIPDHKKDFNLVVCIEALGVEAFNLLYIEELDEIE